MYSYRYCRKNVPVQKKPRLPPKVSTFVSVPEISTFTLRAFEQVPCSTTVGPTKAKIPVAEPVQLVDPPSQDSLTEYENFMFEES